MAEGIEKQARLYRFGQFEMNAKEQILRRNDEIVPLTPKIFETLLLLVRNNGRLLSKDEIMKTLWCDSFVEETNLTSNISRLRKILNADGEQFIQTFPKRGYRFRAEIEEIEPETQIIVTRRVRTQIQPIAEETNEDKFAAEYAAYLTDVPNNLSAPGAAIIGRAKEIDEIENLLRQPKTKLLTLTGVGGTGKTRLAQEIALRLLPEFSDGVFFVALDAIKSVELIIPEIAQVFGVKESSEKSLIEMLKGFLQTKQLLLVADNFEQIVSAAPFLMEILNRAPQLKILVTSRVLLNIQQEREFRVPPLGLPADITKSSFADLSGTEAVKLFSERAKAVKSSFIFNEENAPVIGSICMRLEGLPLAIELAAARIKILSPEQILTRLENRLKLLTGGSRDLPVRQQTMRGTIEWSYDLLNQNEKILFGRLAIFAGGFNIDGVESICSSEEIDLLNCLISLVESSLVVQTETVNGESRFRLLEVIREYALEILEVSGESETIGKKHAQYFHALGKAAESEFFGRNAANWLNRLEEEHDNLRAALSWAVIEDPETLVSLAASLRSFWLLHNHLTEGRQWIETALEQSLDAAPHMRFKLLHGYGQAALYQGDNLMAQKMFEESLMIGRTTGDKRQIALSNRGLGSTAKMQGNIAEARKFIEEALTINRDSGDLFGIAVSLNNLGDLARMQDDYVSARRLFEEALTICRRLGNKEGICGCLNNLGAVTYCEGDFESAQAHYAEALVTSQEIGDKITISYSLNGFAALAVESGDVARAIKLTEAAKHLRESLGFEIEPAERRFCQRYLSEFKIKVDEAAFTNLCEQGRKLKLEESIALCFEESGGSHQNDKRLQIDDPRIPVNRDSKN